MTAKKSKRKYSLSKYSSYDEHICEREAYEIAKYVKYEKYEKNAKYAAYVKWNTKFEIKRIN